MCNRYSAERRAEIRELAAVIIPGVDLPEDWRPHVNIPPTSLVPVLTVDSAQPFRLMRWGTKTKAGLIMNARSETLTETGLWKAAAAHDRCIMLADGFWEWQTIGSTKRGQYFSLPGRRPFPIAAIRLQATPDQPDRCVMVTNEPNELVRPFHDRMPTLLTPEGAKEWLGEHRHHDAMIKRLCQPWPGGAMNHWPTTPAMNRNAYQEPDAVLPWSPEPDLFG